MKNNATIKDKNIDNSKTSKSEEKVSFAKNNSNKKTDNSKTKEKKNFFNTNKEKLQYESFGYTKEDIPEMIKGFLAHFKYTFSKLVKNKWIWISGSLFSIVFLFTWRPLFGLDHDAALLSGYIFGIIVIMVLPMLSAFFISKAYRDERDNGDLLFLITKKDSKFLVYSAKYVASIMAAWFWIFIMLLFSFFWIFLKTFLVSASPEMFEDILGKNFPIETFGYFALNGILVVLLSFFVIVFWSSIFFLLSRVLGSRGVVLTAMLPIMSILIFPLIQKGINGFSTSAEIKGIPPGEYSYIETSGIKDVDINFNLDIESDLNSIYLDRYINFDYISGKEVGNNGNDKIDLFSEWHYDSKNQEDENILEINPKKAEGFKGLIENQDARNKWQHPSSPSNGWDWSTDDSDYEYSINDSEGETCHAQKCFGIDINKIGWRNFNKDSTEDNLNFKYNYKNLEPIENNNKAGWLSFLNPMYYTSVLVEQPLKIIPGIKTTLTDNSKILSSIFGGTHNAVFKEEEKNYSGEIYLPVVNTNANEDRQRIESFPKDFFNVYINYGSYNNLYLKRADEYNPLHEDFDYAIRTFGIQIEYYGEGIYEGVDYWMDPVLIGFMLTVSGLLISWLSIYLNSRHDISR